MNDVTAWARFIGIPLRPWSGMAPVSLILRGVIHTVICLLLIYACFHVVAPGKKLGGAATMQELSPFRSIMIPVVILLIALALYGLLRLTVGVLDLVPRRTVSGIVVSLAERKLGDFLPVLVQRLIWDRGFYRSGYTGYDRRRTRTELVLETSGGLKRWTIRNRRLNKWLSIGHRVTISVSPLVGYVAKVEPL